MKKRNPRHGSMQFWPRVRASREQARVRTWAPGKGLLGFAGYKVGMTHLIVTDNRATSKTKGQEISTAATIIECPPMKVAGIRFYSSSQPKTQILHSKLDKDLAKTISLPKKEPKKIEEVSDYDDLRLLVYTQPRLTGIGKKRPELFEVEIGGSNEEKIEFAKEKLGKEITVEEVFKEGEQLDIHAVTKGKGFQGPVKRFGISLQSHKAEKGNRRVGSLGGWRSQGHVMYRIAHAGQMGYHQRTEYNKHLLKISAEPKEVNQTGGFVRYGQVKNSYIIMKGSIAGPKKRIIKLSHAIRPKGTVPKEAPAISYISVASKQ